MKRFFSVTIFTGLLTLSRLLGGLLISKAVAVYVGPQGVAMLGQVQNFVSFINGVATSPTASAVVRFTSENESKGYQECSKSWKASSTVSFYLLIPITLLILVFSEQISEYLLGTSEYVWVLYLTIGVVPLAVTNVMLTSIINGFQNYKKYVSIGMISVFFSTTAILWLIIYYGLVGALVASVIYYGVMGFVVLVACRNELWFKVCYILGRPEKQYVLKVLPYVFMALSTALITPITQTLIRNDIVDSFGWDIAGNWQAVWDISKAYTSIVTIALGTYFLPKLSKINSYLDMKKEVKKTLALVIPVTVLLSFCVYLVRDFLVLILFSEEFGTASQLFLFQLLGDVVKVTCWVVAYPMISKGTVKWFIASELLFSLSFYIATTFFLESSGVVGATYAYFLGMVINLCFMSINFKRYAV